MSRRQVREKVIDILYRYEITQDKESLVLDESLKQTKHLDIKYCKILIDGIKEHLAELDDIIKSSSENWNINRIFAVDKNILRLAIFEMKYMEDVPCKVAINEALELAKKYGTTDSYRFVNGILDHVMKGIKK